MGDEPIGLVRRSQAEAIASCGIQTVRGDLVAMAVDELAATIVELLRTPALSRLTLDLTRGGTASARGWVRWPLTRRRRNVLRKNLTKHPKNLKETEH
ncbi:MAG: hypothetical protein EA367_04335 [Leptolyngbya sp. DLM2.Bin15]|nr:MAG: hypothetical protein EA367_04335 [Leptolyngbya sp. DLM2.Bin15]